MADVDFDAILAKRASRHPEDERKRQAYLVEQGSLAIKRQSWMAARDNVRNKVARGETVTREEMDSALANPDRLAVDAERVKNIAAAKRRVKEASANGRLPESADILLIMDED